MEIKFKRTVPDAITPTLSKVELNHDPFRKNDTNKTSTEIPNQYDCLDLYCYFSRIDSDAVDTKVILCTSHITIDLPAGLSGIIYADSSSNKKGLVLTKPKYRPVFYQINPGHEWDIFVYYDFQTDKNGEKVVNKTSFTESQLYTKGERFARLIIPSTTTLSLVEVTK